MNVYAAMGDSNASNMKMVRMKYQLDQLDMVRVHFKVKVKRSLLEHINIWIHKVAHYNEQSTYEQNTHGNKLTCTCCNCWRYKCTRNGKTPRPYWEIGIQHISVFSKYMSQRREKEAWGLWDPHKRTWNGMKYSVGFPMWFYFEELPPVQVPVKNKMENAGSRQV